jgi:hypothetical protein
MILLKAFSSEYGILSRTYTYFAVANIFGVQVYEGLQVLSLCVVPLDELLTALYRFGILTLNGP